MVVKDLLTEGIRELSRCGLKHSELDVQLLLGHCLGMSRTQIFLAAEEKVEENCQKEFRRLLARRTTHEPIAYLLREREFWSLPFFVNEHVLIPRPETEFLLETVLGRVKELDWVKKRVLDLCCGSGVIGIVLALELKTKVVATDLSYSALQVARSNSMRHGVDNLVHLVNCDLMASLASKQQFSLIVSNPPYVTSQEILGLDSEVKDHEPRLALDGGDDGLDLIRKIRNYIADCLLPGGFFFMEFGVGQGPAIRDIFCGSEEGEREFTSLEIIKDYTGRERVFIARKKI